MIMRFLIGMIVIFMIFDLSRYQGATTLLFSPKHLSLEMTKSQAGFLSLTNFGLCLLWVSRLFWILLTEYQRSL